MQFNNKQFENGVRTSLSSLKNLKNGLNMDESVKGLNALEKAGRGFNLAPMANAVESVSIKFSALQVVAFTALQNITNSAINTGKQLIKSLTVDPIKQGFDEYELKMGSIQTIMAGTGESLETVSGYLDKLNSYADRTIYSFSDMTSNIGKFTNAGVNLDRSVAAIQGISNAAALAGANSTNASHAMYNFAQALSAGYVKLIDWKSIETANMATVGFKEQLLEAGVAAGTLAKTSEGMYKVLSSNGSGTVMKETISATKNFNDSLQYQWMNTETLISTLGKYADETTEIGKAAFAAATEVKTFTQLLDTMKEAVGSGWAQTWEHVIGDFHEAKEVLTELSQAFDKIVSNSADARNGILSDWKELGGRTALINALRNALISLGKIIGTITGAYKDIFPPKTGEQLLSLSNALLKFTEKLIPTATVADRLKRTFKGLFAVLDIGKEALSAVLKGFSSIIGFFLPASKGVLAVTASLGDFLVMIRDIIKESGIFNRVFTIMGAILRPLGELLKNTIYILVGAIATLVQSDTFKVLQYNLIKLYDSVIVLFGALRKTILMPGFERFKELLVIIIGMIGPFMVKAVEGFKTFSESASEKVQGVNVKLENFTSILSFLGSKIGAFLDPITSKFKQLFGGISASDAIGVGLLATLIATLHKNLSPMGKMFTNASQAIDSVKDTLVSYQKSIKYKSMQQIAGAILMLAGALVLLSFVNTDKLVPGLLGLGALLVAILVTMKLLEKIDTKGLVGATVGIGLLGATMVIFANALSKLSSIEDSSTAIKTFAAIMIGIITMLFSISSMTKMTPNLAKDLVLISGGLIIFGAAFSKMAKVIDTIGAMPVENLKQGLKYLAILLAELGIFFAVVQMGQMKGVASVISALAIGLLILQVAINKFSEIDPVAFDSGVKRIGLVLAGLALAVVLMSGANIKGAAVTLVALAGALMLLVAPIRALGEMDLAVLEQGMISIGLLLLGITASMAILSAVSSGGLELAGMALALIGMAVAMNLIVIPLKVLSSIPWQALAVGLAALIIPLLAFAGLSVLLAPLGPALFIVGGALAVFGVALLAIGAGMGLAVGAFVAFAAAGTAAAAAFLAALSLIIVGLAKMAPVIEDGLRTILQVIANLAPDFAATFKVIVSNIIDVIIDLTPKVGKAISTLLETVLKVIVDFIPKAILAIGDLIKGIINAVKKLLGINSPSSVFIEIGSNIIQGLLNGLKNGAKKIANVAKEMASNLANGVKKFLGIKSPSTLFRGFGTDVVDGFTGGIKGNLPAVTKASEGIGTAAESPLKNKAKDFRTIGKDLIDNFLNGMNRELPKAKDTSEYLGLTAMDGFGDVAKSAETKQTGSDFTETIATGISSSAPKVNSAAKEVAKGVYEINKEWIDKQKEYHGLSLEDELSKWEETLTAYKDGSDEYLKVMKHISETEDKIRQKSFDHSKGWISKEKEYKRISLFEELEAWERVQARFEKGTTQRTEADKELFRVRNELIDKQKQIDNEYYEGSKVINDQLKQDISDLTLAYEQAVADRTSHYANMWGIFEKVEKPEEPIDGKELVSSLQSQVEAFDRWQREVTMLSKKGLDEGLMQELRDLGPKSVYQITALNRLSTPELEKYSELWKTKHEQAKTQAIAELEDLRVETSEAIKGLEDQAKIDLDALQNTWKIQTKELVNSVVDEYQVMGDNIIEGLRTLRGKSKTEISATNTEIKSTINKENWSALGFNITQGIAQGISNGEGGLISAMRSLARRIKGAAESELQINSPSKVFMKIGEHVVAGFSNGIVQNGSKAIDGISNTMSNIVDNILQSLDSDMSIQPTIRPVVDLTNINGKLDTAFANRNITANTTMRRTRMVSSAYERSTLNRETPSTKNEETTINNEFIVHATIREESDIRKVSKDLNRRQNANKRGKGVLAYDRN